MNISVLGVLQQENPTALLGLGESKALQHIWVSTFSQTLDLILSVLFRLLVCFINNYRLVVNLVIFPDLLVDFYHVAFIVANLDQLDGSLATRTDRR